MVMRVLHELAGGFRDAIAVVDPATRAALARTTHPRPVHAAGASGRRRPRRVCIRHRDRHVAPAPARAVDDDPEASQGARQRDRVHGLRHRIRPDRGQPGRSRSLRRDRVVRGAQRPAARVVQPHRRAGDGASRSPALDARMDRRVAAGRDRAAADGRRRPQHRARRRPLVLDPPPLVHRGSTARRRCGIAVSAGRRPARRPGAAQPVPGGDAALARRRTRTTRCTSPSCRSARRGGGFRRRSTSYLTEAGIGKLALDGERPALSSTSNGPVHAEVPVPKANGDTRAHARAGDGALSQRPLRRRRRALRAAALFCGGQRGIVPSRRRLRPFHRGRRFGGRASQGDRSALRRLAAGRPSRARHLSAYLREAVRAKRAGVLRRPVHAARACCCVPGARSGRCTRTAKTSTTRSPRSSSRPTCTPAWRARRRHGASRVTTSCWR